MHALEYQVFSLVNDVKEDKVSKEQLIERLTTVLVNCTMYRPLWNHPTDNGKDYPRRHRERVRDLKDNLITLVEGWAEDDG